MNKGEEGRSLRVIGISKTFGALTALNNVSVEFLPGEVHAVLGENGAGKSTLAGIIGGFVHPTSGSVTLGEHPLPLGKPMDCKRLGIEMIHQHFTLVPHFSVAENLALSRMNRLSSVLDVKSLTSDAFALGVQLGWPLDPNAAVGTLSVGEQQRIEILKALVLGGQVVLFDEPTAVLTKQEAAELLAVLGKLRQEGRTIILIAHKLAEVMAIADRVTVLRRGKKVAEAARGEFDEARLAKWMVGEIPPSESSSGSNRLDLGLKVSNLFVQGDRKKMAVSGASFEIRRGEILGIGGVDGNGQFELAEALAGIRSPESGSIEFEGKAIESDLQVGYIPQDRRRDGLALSMTVADNALAGNLGRRELSVGPFLRVRSILRWAASLIGKFQIAASGPKTIVGNLSGGNQQKVVVSRVLDVVPSLLVAAGPSRGLDVRATAFVHEQIRQARDSGSAVALFSTDIDELMDLADRSIYMSSGQIVEGSGPEAYLGLNT